MAIVHYRNLTNGLFCDCPPWTLYKTRVVRLQSTACEQKRWEAILHELGADLYYNLATGESCIIHDKSERERETRACWQGLSWVRYACHRAWREGEPPMEFSRGGMPLNPYWEEQYRGLSRSGQHLLKYFKKFDVGGMLDVYSCYTPPVVRKIHVEKSTEKAVRNDDQHHPTADEGGHHPNPQATEVPAWTPRPEFVTLPY